MYVFTTHGELRSFLKKQTGSIGLVPTMGALHKGHLSLVQKAAENNNWVLVSIFINPTQFNNANDLTKYPKNTAKDLELLTPYNTKLIVYTPDDSDLYPKAINAKKYNFGSLAEHMEGAFRDNHFNGVATVIEALFRNLKPDRAYFGEKDFQQLQIIKVLNDQLNLGIEIIGCPIIREIDGIAMSSRNQLLNKKERNTAPIIFQTLRKIDENSDQWDVNYMTHFFKKSVEKNSFLRVEYFFVAEETTLIPVKNLKKQNTYRIFVAVNAGKTRLIDTLKLGRI
jgi:pantoate--beta-alanine ligase